MTVSRRGPIDGIWLTAFSVVALSLAATSGCASSLRMRHLSDVFFERCYAADRQESYTANERKSCWTGWLEHYSRLQPPDRVDYAMSRAEALDNLVEPLALMTSEQPEAAEGKPHLAESQPPPANQSCKEACAPSHETCLLQCEAEDTGEGCRRTCNLSQSFCENACP